MQRVYSSSRLIAPPVTAPLAQSLVIAGLACSLAAGCANTHGHAHSHIGESESVEQSGQRDTAHSSDEETIGVTSEADLTAAQSDEIDAAQSDEIDAAQSDEIIDLNDPSGSSEGQLGDSAAEAATPEAPMFANDPILESPEARDERLAQAALSRVSANNHLGLKMAIVERASDLPWILAIQNSSEKDVNLAALPELLRLEVTAPIDAEESESSETSSTSKKPVLCSAQVPKKLAKDDSVVLPAGATLHYSFDPESVCSEPSVLSAGAEVQATYGFVVTKKKVWQKGKLVEIEETEKGPFVAERAEEDTAMVGLKELAAPSFTLGSTYPLERLMQEARAEEAAFKKQQAEALGEEASQEPLEVSLAPLGTAREPEEGLIRVSVKNVSDEAVQIYLRREHFAYQVSGPRGSTTCQMFPSNPAATEISFTTLSPGRSMSLSTRLAEACPKGTWGPPGDYQVAVVFSPNQTGAEFKKNAYVGTVLGKNTTTLTIPGETKSPMRVSAPTP